MARLVNHPSLWLRDDAAAAFDRAEADHGRFVVNSAGRTEAQQQLLINRWDRGGRNNRPPALYEPKRPARLSNHVVDGGKAVDLADWRRFAPVAAAYGYSHPYPAGDPVHFEFVGVPQAVKAAGGEVNNDTRNRQIFLNSRGWSLVVDGREGPRTKQAYKDYQKFLKARGLYAGAIDGIWGPGTQAAHQTYWNELNAAPKSPTAPAPTANLSYAQIQQALVNHGYKIKVDNVWGPKSSNALAAFQKSKGLYPDRIVGPKTRAALGI